MMDENKHILGKEKTAEDKLLENENFSREVIESMSDGFSILDKNGVHLFANKALCEMTGFSKEELIGVGVPHPYWPEDEYENIQEAFVKTTQGNFERFELYFKKKNGIKFPVLVNPSQIKDEKGNVICNFASIQDITEQKKTANELGEINEKYFNLMESLGTGVVLHAPDTRILLSNTMASEILGISSEQMQGKKAIDPRWKFINEDGTDMPLEEYPVNRAIRLMKSFSEYHVGFKRPDRKYITWVNVNASIISDSSNNLKYITISFNDITEQKLAKQELKESERRLMKSQKIANVGFIDVNLETKYVEFSKETYNIYGVNKAEFSRTIENTMNFIFPEDAKFAYKNIERAIKGKKKGFDMEHRIIRPDGKIIWIHATAKTSFNESGKPVRLFGTVQDISERKQIEEEKYKAIFLTEEREQSRIATDLHDGVGQTIAAANMYINALVDIIKDQVPVDTYSTFLATKKLVNEATSEIRLVSHNIMPPSLKQYGVEHTVNELINNYQKIRPGISFKYISTIGGIRFDGVIELSIYRCIKELLSNAIKHAKAKAIKVEIENVNTRIKIKVTDNGIGFDLKKELSKKGAGIGLTNVTHRTASSGGKLLVESTPHKGTIITLTFVNCIEQVK